MEANEELIRPPSPRKWPRLLIRRSDQCGLLYFSTVMGNFVPYPKGITSQLKKRSVCILFGVSVCMHLNSLFKFSCCSYHSYKKVLHLSAPTWIHVHMQKWKEHTQAGSDWSQKIPKYLPNTEQTMLLLSALWFPIYALVTPLHTLISDFHNFPWHDFMRSLDTADGGHVWAQPA